MRRALVATLFLLAVSSAAEAATSCVFDVAAGTMRLEADCTTDASIVIPDGLTLDGNYHTITAVDPPGRHFLGAILVNGGRRASVINTRLEADALANICDVGDARLRGILFDGASGVLKGNTILDINQGASACQEGNAIELWNLSGAPVLVEIADNVVDRYQKSGIVASGAVDVSIRYNVIGSSATQAMLSANAIQIGFGAWASIEHNDITGNRWPLADAAATAVLLSRSAAGTLVRHNTISGNADVGIYAAADAAVIAGNVLFDDGPDGFYDIGIVSLGANVVRDNDIRGFDDAQVGVGGEQPAADVGLQVE
jgi:putative cofactor-binding repeat protein